MGINKEAHIADDVDEEKKKILKQLKIVVTGNFPCFFCQGLAFSIFFPGR